MSDRTSNTGKTSQYFGSFLIIIGILYILYLLLFLMDPQNVIIGIVVIGIGGIFYANAVIQGVKK